MGGEGLSRQTIAAIIPAAGQSRRMGQPKLLLPWGGTTVLGQVVASFGEAGLGAIVVVSGAEREKVEGLAAGLAGKYPVQCVHNAAYPTGEMLSSLQCGLAALGPEFEAALIGLGDQPQIEPETVRRILDAYEYSKARIVVPSYHMRRGHPWLVQRSLWDEIRALQAPLTLRDYLNTHAGEIAYVAVETASVLEDLDSPEDYRHHP
jgi:molybdenum cofactor cytidylyltransferase